MAIYGLFRRFLPPMAAGIACAIFYAAVILAIVLLLPVAPADFRYGRY